MIYIDYKGNDTYEYLLSTGESITLSDSDLEEIYSARKGQNDKGFKSNNSLNLLQDEGIEDGI